MNLPAFKYHPDPLASGSVAPSNNECVHCGKASGYVYTATAYAEEDYDDNICPWCIADGSAHRDLGVEFFDCEGIGDVPDAVMEEIMQRTPGYASFQPGK